MTWNCFDASALVKVYTDEDGSSLVRQYFHSAPSKYTTLSCYYETLNVLKRKRFYQKPPNNITNQKYHDAAFELSAWFSSSTKSVLWMSPNYVRDLDFVDPQTFPKVKSIALKHSLDLSDAFQILSVKEGFASSMQPILVTADNPLATAARNEGIKVREYRYDTATSNFVVVV